MAQLAKTVATTQEQSKAKRGTKITFPLRAMSKVKALSDEELVSTLIGITINVVGNSEQETVCETANGEKILMKKSAAMNNSIPIWFKMDANFTKLNHARKIYTHRFS